jgi:hypothetical protein
MTIVEKNNRDSPWLFRTQRLQTDATQLTHETALELAQSSTPVSVPIPPHQPVVQQKQPQPQKHLSSVQVTPAQPQQEQQQRIQQNQNLRTRVPTGPIPVDPKKVVKSSTAPNLPTSNSLSEMFRVI